MFFLFCFSFFVFFVFLQTNYLNLELYLNRCQYLSAVLRVHQAAGRPDVQDSPNVALIVCLVQMDRSATRLVVTYRFIYKVSILNTEFLPGEPPYVFAKIPQSAKVVQSTTGQTRTR